MMPRIPYKFRGLSLIELMVALTIGLVLMLGVVIVYANSRSAYRLSEHQTRMADDARYVWATFNRDIARAGYWPNGAPSGFIEGRGATASISVNGDCAGDAAVANLDAGLQVFSDATTTPNVPACIIGHGYPYKPDTDVIVVRYADTRAVTDAGVTPGLPYIKRRVGTGLENAGVLYQPGTGTTVPSTTVTNPNNNHRLHYYMYYIGRNSHRPGDGIPSLRRLELVGNQLRDQLLVSGVEYMTVQLGVDVNDGASGAGSPDGGLDVYVDPGSGQISQDNILGVRVMFVMRSEQPLNDVPQDERNFEFGAREIPMADDQFYRLEFSQVVRKRNRSCDVALQNIGGC